MKCLSPSIRALCAAVALFVAATALADIPRTPDGKPDMQGVWANNAATPLERPEQLSDKAELSEEEVAQLRARHDELFNGETDAAFGDSVFNAVLAAEDDHESYDPETGNYNHFWVVDREFEARTSLIVDPPNGRLPELTEQGEANAAAYKAHMENHPADSYTDRINSDRCITYGVPFIAAGYNGYFQIAQNPETVVILQEMAHESRIVNLDDRPPLDEDLRQWTGAPRGHWEGDTLVVETANFSPKSMFMGARENLQLTERFTLRDAETLEWALTIRDDSTWVQPWTAVINLKRSPDEIFEYACHEGNLSMEGILAGHRAEEAEAAAAASQSGGGG